MPEPGGPLKLLFTAPTALVFPMPGHAAIAGDWAGVLTFPQRTLAIALHVTGPDHALRATADSPDQGAVGGSIADGWSARGMETVTNDPGEMAVLADADRAGTKALIDEAVIGGYTIRPGTVEHIVVNGQQAFRAIGEYKDPAGEPMTELLVWVSAEDARAISISERGHHSTNPPESPET